MRGRLDWNERVFIDYEHMVILLPQGRIAKLTGSRPEALALVLFTGGAVAALVAPGVRGHAAARGRSRRAETGQGSA
jgi:hypothetical protein